uniref:DH domain-containing protein n=1 Tax=Glossina palpalis gambiensis TaxID=67801 RepID=A0A1B0BGS2_9MUSC
MSDNDETELRSAFDNHLKNVSGLTLISESAARIERLRGVLVDMDMFLPACQKRLAHTQQLAAYLLKPVQAIAKYRLLLKDPLRFSEAVAPKIYKKP